MVDQTSSWSTDAITKYGDGVIFFCNNKLFRIDEERKPIDVNCNPVDIWGGPVFVAHPALHDLSGWDEHLADFEIAQPFVQVGRELREIEYLDRFEIVGSAPSGWTELDGIRRVLHWSGTELIYSVVADAWWVSRKNIDSWHYIIEAGFTLK